MFCSEEPQILDTSVQNFVARAGARHLSIPELRYSEKGSFVWAKKWLFYVMEVYKLQMFEKYLGKYLDLKGVVQVGCYITRNSVIYIDLLIFMG